MRLFLKIQFGKDDWDTYEQVARWPYWARRG